MLQMVLLLISTALRRTIALGKFGTFPANLILDRPYHFTYEIQDKLPSESYCRLRVLSADEIYEDVFAEEASSDQTSTLPITASDEELQRASSADDGADYTLVDSETNTAVAQTTKDGLRQTLTQSEIEILKKEGASAGKELIAKLMLSHTALDQKTAFSLAKYKLVKTKKYIRRFTVLPLDLVNFNSWQLEQRDASKILDLRAEMLGLVGCLANVHYSEEDCISTQDSQLKVSEGGEAIWSAIDNQDENAWQDGRWLVVDDTGGLLIAAMAERMGILHDKAPSPTATSSTGVSQTPKAQPNGTSHTEVAHDGDGMNFEPAPKRARRTASHQDDFHIPYSRNNTMTLLSASQQPNLAFLKYFGYDDASPHVSTHPLSTHLLSLSWLQLVAPEEDFSYANPPPSASADVVASWKPAHRGNHHRKRRRWARTQYTVHNTQEGNFSGLAVASTMDPIGMLQHTLPLLTGGAPIAIYSPSLEPLAQLADCFSVARRGAWVGGGRPATAEGKTVEELECWEGTEEFPLNPTLVLGATLQTSRVRQWQVLPGRTHPLMSGKGGAEGYVFSGWRARPAEGKVEARGKFNFKKARRAAMAAEAETEPA
jgi:tRNA (adenine-N(1)-)-methyltransferase non-catalytic subunit